MRKDKQIEMLLAEINKPVGVNIYVKRMKKLMPYIEQLMKKNSRLYTLKSIYEKTFKGQNVLNDSVEVWTFDKFKSAYNEVLKSKNEVHEKEQVNEKNREIRERVKSIKEEFESIKMSIQFAGDNVTNELKKKYIELANNEEIVKTLTPDDKQIGEMYRTELEEIGV